MQPAYLIQFPNDRAYERVLEAFWTVPETRCGFPNRRMLVTARHIQALDERKIPYKDLSATADDNDALKCSYHDTAEGTTS